MAKSELKAWSWDACKKRLLELKKSGTPEQAVELWLKIAESIRSTSTREQLAVSLESFERMQETWDQLKMQEWYMVQLGWDCHAQMGRFPRAAQDAFSEAFEDACDNIQRNKKEVDWNEERTAAF